MIAMIRVATVLSLFLATSPLFAKDYGVRFATEFRPARHPLHAGVSVTVEVTKPHPSEGGVVIEIDLPGDDITSVSDCVGTRPVRCTLPPWTELVWVTATMNAPGTFTATARVVSPADENPENDQDTWTFEVVNAPSLSVFASSWRYDPGMTAAVSVYVHNGAAAAKNVVLTMTLPGGGTFTGTPAEECDVTPDTIVCTFPELAYLDGRQLGVSLVLPDRLEGGDVPFTASVASSTLDFQPENDRVTITIPVIRHLIVDNTNDEGAGSLRQALLDAQQFCATVPLCTIDFRIPGAGEEGRFVIRPRSELPEVRGNVELDGATQTRFGGDTNPAGPEIVLDGSEAPPARGLVLGGPSCEMYVLDLAVVNFDGPGIEAYRGPYEYTKCRFLRFPNTLIEGNHLTGNYRGIAVTGPGYLTIVDNVIADNRRAGIFANGSSRVDIVRNRVTGNGASGIFINGDNPWKFQAAVVEENVISGNAEWGIARTFASDSRIRRNSIFGNRYLAIDAGLDFETPNVPEDTAWETGIPNKPVLISAHYDPGTGKTRVHGRLDSETNAGISTFALDFYASDALSAAGQAEMQQWLDVHVLPAKGGHADFVAEIEGDLRGRLITATNTRWHIVGWDEHVFDTSEPSNVLPVH